MSPPVTGSLNRVDDTMLHRLALRVSEFDAGRYRRFSSKRKRPCRLSPG